MFEKIYYVNHLNEKVDLYSGNYTIQNVDSFTSHSLGYDSVVLNNVEQFKNFKKELPLYKITLKIEGSESVSHREASNKICDVFNVDIAFEKPGKLYVNEYYLKCFVFSKNTTRICPGVNSSIHEFQIIATCTYWISDSHHFFNAPEISSTANKRYPGRYKYRYANGMNTTYLVNLSNTPSHFKMIIGGPTVNPNIEIGENNYLVYITFIDGEQLEIDSEAGTVYKITRYGERINAFHNRQKRKTFFNKISSGMQEVKIPLGVSVNLTLFEERSEPKW